MTLFDSHAHLSTFEDAESIIERAFAAEVKEIINIATDPKELEKGLLLAKKFPKVFNAAATTPHDVEKQGEDFFFFAQKAKEGALHAIGETGLDYHYTYSPQEKQQFYLRKYMELATECNLPLIFHCREAFSDLFRIAEEMSIGKALVHCFTGTLEEANEAVRRDWMISISGIVTFKKSADLRDVVRQIPLKNLLIETDAPYLAPQSKRGQVNEPAFITETAQVVAAIKNVSYKELVEATAQNARQFFSL